MSEYDESFEEFEEEVASSTSRSRSPRRSPVKPRAVEAIAETSYEDDEFESSSPVKGSAAPASFSFPPAAAAFSVGEHVQVYWRDEDAWFPGIVQAHDATQGFFVKYEDGDEQWEDEQFIRGVAKVVGAVASARQLPPAASLQVVAGSDVHASDVLPSMSVLNRVLAPRPYKAVADHYTMEKVARPYKSVASHPESSSMFLTPRKFTSAMEQCPDCKARAYDRVLLASQGAMASTSFEVYGERPSDHRFLRPNVVEQESQTHLHLPSGTA
ncbi:Aste57867_3112 [Aphanomyces stellatus]|uniref:Aste57867_3112 protein n=1 Tax=Aphanomyces stellatus TaxID=120398 RepID=A0A485KAN9_9STRA|nr:hypothetical protein As57867_003103 [Aphanomyces stellatus]VFT80288.1 Aste57867_3112 [Aphanomyces stellatus]